MRSTHGMYMAPYQIKRKSYCYYQQHSKGGFLQKYLISHKILSFTGCINFTEVIAGCDPCLKINKANVCKTSIGKLLS